MNNDPLVELNKRRKRDEKTIFVSGNFNILHPGHLRLLKFAKESGDFLVVGVNKKDNNFPLLDESVRLENVASSSYVDYAFLLDEKPSKFIERLKPDKVIKGKEHENSVNPEQRAVDSYGGKLVFCSGNIRFSSLDILEHEFKTLEFSTINKPIDFLKRHSFSFDDLTSILKKIQSLNVVVVGDVIVDEYITCDPLGMSQEDPTIVVSPISKDKFLGGAGIVAAHAASLGAKASFFSVTGKDSNYDFVKSKLKEYNVKSFIYSDESRPTTLKQRFRANGKTLLRVNHVKEHDISKDLQKLLLNEIEPLLRDTDLLIFSDFSYGCLTQNVIDTIQSFCKEKKIVMAADSQSSSQMGDISRFKNMALITPTEREARLALKDYKSGLIILAEKLKMATNAENVFTTLSSEGMLVYGGNGKGFQTERLPAMNKAPKDVSGAGDSLLTCSSLAIAAGGNIWQSAYIGALAAACQVGRLGNIPLSYQELLVEIGA